MFQKKSTLKLSLAERTANVVNIFTKAINDFTAINKEAEEEISVKEQIIANATKECDDLKTMIESNSKIVGNLNKILE